MRPAQADKPPRDAEWETGNQSSMSYACGRDREPGGSAPPRDFMEYLESFLGGLLPAEMRRPLQSQAFHASTQLRVEQQIGDRTHHFIYVIRVEENRRAIHHFGQR